MAKVKASEDLHIKLTVEC
ncbi:Protein of unknown function [Bacillus mycoides]|nr:Protein of unknown function [Bacillus mycoides]